MITFINQMPTSSYMFLEQLLVDCYKYLFNGNEAELDNTINVLRLCGYEKYTVVFKTK